MALEHRAGIVQHVSGPPHGRLGRSPQPGAARSQYVQFILRQRRCLLQGIQFRNLL
jgi:hypothetical protein